MCTTPFTGHSPGFKTINLNFLLNYFIKLTADDQRTTSADVYVVQSSIFALYKQQYTLKCEIFTFLFGSFSLWGKFLEKIFLFGHFEIKPTNADTLNSLIFLIILMCTFNLKKTPLRVWVNSKCAGFNFLNCDQPVCVFRYFNLRLKLWVTHKQRLSAGCQYMSFSGVRKSYLRVTTSSSFMWCRLGPSDSSSSPQQNMKLDGPTSWSPDGQEVSFSKHSWTCSAIPAQTTEGACRISGCFFMCFRLILQREMNIQERTGLHLSFTIRSANLISYFFF